MIYFPERMLKPPPGIGFPNYTYLAAAGKENKGEKRKGKSLIFPRRGDLPWLYLHMYAHMYV